MALRHRDQRLDGLRNSLNRIVELRESLRQVACSGELNRLFADLDVWFTSETFNRICAGALSTQAEDVEAFVGSLRTIADDYATATPLDIDALQVQLRFGVPT